MRSAMAAPLLSALLFCSAAAQLESGNLRVRITYPDGRACDIQVLVRLMGSVATSPVAEAYTNDAGMVEFDNLKIGNYHLVVSGQGIEETNSETFEVDSRKGSQYLYVVVKRVSDAQSNSDVHDGATVAPADFGIPKRAARQFDKATHSMGKQEWKKALDQLTQVLALYPNYAAAYVNLAVVYAHLHDRAAERAALQKALGINDHYAPALVNLAKMAIADRDFPAAESLLDKATAADPTDSRTLLLLANVELLDRHYDLAVANSHKVHSAAQEPHALVHYIAARALEHENRLADAIAELRTFLGEEPSGLRANAVRQELSGLGVQVP